MNNQLYARLPSNSWWTIFNLFLINSVHQRTALHAAADEGHVNIVRYLVNKGADTNSKDQKEASE